MKYILADELIAEIDRRIKHQLTCIENEYRLSGKAEEEIIFEYKSLSNFITSLQQEQPEVDIRKELGRLKLMGSNDARDIENIARHFYELGKARKEE